MSFPPTLRDSVDESIFGDDFIDIHMDPNSIPAPAMAPVRAINDNISDEEEEEEEEEDPEEDPDQDPEQDMDETSGEPAGPLSEDEPVEAIPSFYARGSRGTGALRTARMRVRFPSSDYASTSRARAPHHSPTPSVTPSPTPGRVAPPTPSSPIGYTPSSEPSSPVRASPFSLPYSPTTLYSIPPSPAAEPQPPSHTPSPARETLLSAPNQTAPVSPRSPHPTLFETTDPAISSLRDNAYAVGNRISQIERNLTEIPGPDSFNDLEERVQTMGRRMDHLSGQVMAMERRIADQVRDLRMREGADRVEIHNLRRRLRILEDRFSGMYTR